MPLRCEICGGIALDNGGLAEPCGETCHTCYRWICVDCVRWDKNDMVMCKECFDEHKAAM